MWEQEQQPARPPPHQMEATALSLARSVLDGVLSNARVAVFAEAARVIGVAEEADFIRQELEMMRSFLRVASAHPEAAARHDTVRTWVNQVRDLANDVEDCLLDFELYAARASSSRGGSLLPCAIAERRRIGERIRRLKANVEQLNNRNQRYRIAVADAAAAAGAGAVDQAAALHQHQHHHDAHAAELASQESDIIGRVEEKDYLTKLVSGAAPGESLRRRMPFLGLLSSFLFSQVVDLFCVPIIGAPGEVVQLAPSRGGVLRVVSVWGMGGMGKSSLARMVHNDPVLLDEFDCDAWVTVPHPLDSADAFRKRLAKELGVASNQNVAEHLQRKRYLVIVDDVQRSEEWDNILQVFPTNNNEGSRIIVTTRHMDVARHCATPGHDYELKPLGDAESMDLLCLKIYGTTNIILAEDMMQQAKHILKRCRGFPLAISTIGGLLANKPKTSIEWSNLHEYIGAVLEDLPGITKVIDSSFDGLPYYLKQIFLYLSIFPENQKIKRTRLIRRWMAEGYITNNQNKPVEDVGEDYYKKLINRSMIQGSKANRGVGFGRCWVHSMVLQVIRPKFIEENQLFRAEKPFNDIPQSKIRHLVVSGWKQRDERMQRINLAYIRSLTIFGEYPSSLISPKMRMLRVLDLEDTLNMKNDDLKHIGELQHLRYLSLRGTGISKLPSSLQNLRYLETLDIQDTCVTQLPGDIAKLEKLRNLVAGVNFTKDLIQKMRGSGDRKHEARIFGESYLRCNRSECCEVLSVNHIGVRSSEGIEKLKNLHMLGVVNVAKGNGVAGRLKKLMSLTNLRRLGISGLTEEEGQELCRSIGGINRLQRLEVHSASIKFLDRIDEPEIPRHLVSLRLCGKLNMIPEWVSSLNNLVKVKLLGTQLNQQDISRLQNLSSLVVLGLWEKSYIEESLRFSANTFPKLKILDIDGLEKIRNVTVWNGAMPQLEELSLNKCPSLHDNSFGLSGVQYLLSLKELLLKNCGEKQNLIDVLQGHIDRHSRRPKFLIGRSRIIL